MIRYMEVIELGLGVAAGIALMQLFSLSGLI